MSLMRVTSPHTQSGNRTTWVMGQVLLATVPGVAVLTAYFGPGTLINLFLAVISAVLFEAGILWLRRKPIVFYLKDLSAVVTAVLLAIALPPYCPWWLVVIGMFFSIVVAKHLYGGLGFNPFNPAMVGYVVLLISFPVAMTQWASPVTALAEGQSLPSLTEAFRQVFAAVSIDGYTAATPLDVVKQREALTLAEVYQSNTVLSEGRWAGAGWEWANIAFLIGGIFLLARRIFTWHAPIAMLASITVLSALFYGGGGSESLGSPLFHLLSGATMFGAFFIITDPVTSTVSTRGRLIYGALIGVVIFVIRAWGNYPDAVAFAVLLLNFAAPFIDYYTTPRTYGHVRPNRTHGLGKEG